MCHAFYTSWNNETGGEYDDQNGITTESCLITRISTMMKICIGLNQEIKEYGGVSLKQSINVRWLSFINLLESIDRSFFSIRKVLANKKKTFAIEREVVQGLIRLLLPFKELLTKLQTSKTPSIHLVLIGIGSLRTTLSSFDMLLEYEKKNKIYFQEENLDSLDFNSSNSIQEDEGNLIFIFFIKLILNQEEFRAENNFFRT